MSVMKSLWGEHPRRSDLHAPGERLAHDLLDRDDPCVDPHRLDQQGHVRGRVSLWALVSGHWSAWQAARVEVEQAKEAEKRKREDIPGEVVERIVEETEVQEESEMREEAQRSASS